MSQFLVFQLKAPLASFGSSVGTYRATDTRPRRGVVVGLLAAALGIERSQSDRFTELNRALRLGHIALKPGTVMTDYHTVQAPAERKGRTRRDQLATGTPNNILTTREYLQNGHWLVVLQGGDEVLEQCRQALEAPAFTLFIGRKSCVLSAHTAPLVLEATHAEEALKAWAAAYAVKLPQQASFYWEDGMAVEAVPTASHLRNDVRLSLQHNFFDQRAELAGVLN